MNLKRHIVTLMAAVLLAAVAPTVYAQVRVAVVDLQRALNATEDGRAAKRQLKRLFKRRQADLDKKQNELKKMKAEIEKQKDALSRKALAAKLEEYQAKFVELQSSYVESQRELSTKEVQLTKRILQRMQRILRSVGAESNYTLIVERNEGGIVWADDGLDLTEEVVRRYNAGEGRTGMGMGMGGMGMSSMMSE